MQGLGHDNECFCSAPGIRASSDFSFEIKTPGVHIVNPKKLETWLRTNSAGIPYTLLLKIEAIGFPTFGPLPYAFSFINTLES